MRPHDRSLLFAVVLLVLAVLCLSVAFTYPYDSSGFPRGVSVVFLIFAIVHLVTSMKDWKGQENLDEASNDGNGSASGSGAGRAWVAALGVFLSAPFYILLARLFDFEIATFVYLVAGMYLLKMRRPFVVVLVAIGTLLVVKGLFFYLLDVSRAPTLVFGG